MNWCRLCGEEKSPLDFVVELSDKANSNWIYSELIEFHTRVSLKTNKLLPQSICEECRTQVDNFVAFSTRIQAVQENIDAIDTDATTQEDQSTKKPIKRKNDETQNVGDLIKLEFVDLPPLKLEIEFLESEVLLNGEVPDSARETLSLEVWSNFLSNCEACQVTVDNFVDLHLHHENVHNNEDVENSCKLCGKKFERVFEYLNHLANKHAEHLKHCCLVCDGMFYDLTSLLNHFSQEHNTESLQIFQCLLCGEFNDSLAALRVHTTEKHQRQIENSFNKSDDGSCESRTRSKRTRRDGPNEYIERSDEEHLSSDEDSDDKPKRNHERSRKPRGSKKGNTTVQRKIFGPEIDSFEKLFADEIKGLSQFKSSLHLNVNEEFMLPNGEIPEEYALAVSDIRWKDLLSCGICKVSYSDIGDLLTHADNKHSTRSKLFHCQSCEGEFSAVCESPLINHMIERHYYEHLKFCCLVCSKMFYNLPLLMAHYKTHTKKFEVLACLICGWYAKTLDDLKEHKSIHLSSEKSENQELCEKVYERFKSGLEPSGRNHCVAEYERNPDGTVTNECQQRFNVDWSFGRYECSICDVQFSNPFEIFVHYRLKHTVANISNPKDISKKIYSCSLCTDKKDFTNLFTFVNHATSKHLDNAKFVCICCSKVFWNYLALADHYKDVHTTFPCIFCCHCGKIFMNVSVASSHFRTLNLFRTPEERKLLKEGKILDEMSHICHVCARSFKNRGTLLNHVKTHETIEPSELLQCHICSKFYKNKYKLQQHMVCHEDLRSWKCKACGQAFNYKKLLQRHIQAVHENERAFGCTFCEKRFNSKYDLKVHVRLHTGEMPYQCPVPDCDAKYPAWSNLFKHCQSRHKLDIRSDGYKKLKATQKSQKNVEEYESD